jgi:hypothetical protein
MAKSSLATFAKRRPPYFWWILAHALALCFTTLSWFLSLYVFNNPELPQNYRILEKIGRAPVPQAFTALDAPQGVSIRPDTIYRNYASLATATNAKKLKKTNVRLLRAYLQSYAEVEKPTYIEGDYRILQIRPLTAKDLFYPGFVIRAQALIQPDKLRPPGPYPVLIEYMYPCENKAAFTWCKPGDLLDVKKIPNCVALLHIAHLGTTDEPIINLTVAPIAYGDIKIGENRLITTFPPTQFNLIAQMPLFPNAIPASE